MSICLKILRLLGLHLRLLETGVTVLSNEKEITTFVFYREWIDSLEGIEPEIQDKVIAEIARYGCGLPLLYEDEPAIASYVKLLKGRIDYKKNEYANKVIQSQSAGRGKKFEDNQVYNLARQGMKSKEIADMLGVSKSSIDHSEGWKKRYDSNFEF